ncbi:MAG: nicotinamide-nucleotide adenylyltransferase [Candidatus Micrarchaeota archaeon]|nr:nicotinamide-nucleotide adenylyltransferase [Candidatus Micrarchaeota archaeon]
MKKNPTALFIGRFQPFHKGHLAALRWIAARSGRVIVAVGSAQESGTPANPFSLRERMQMLKKELAHEGLAKKCILAAVTDINSNERWVAHLDASVPPYDVAYSNNPLVRKLMKKAGRRVRRIPFFRKKRYNATEIRRLMKEGKRWEDRVPEKVEEVLKRSGALEKLRR